MDDIELIGALESELENSLGYNSGVDPSSERSTALDYYYSRKRGDEVKGRSQVVSSDVSDMTDATLAQMMQAFVHDTVAHFEPEGVEDVQQAQLETEAINYAFMEWNRGYNILRDAAFDALLLKNCAAKVYWDEEEHVEIVSLDQVSAEQLAMAMSSAGPNERVELIELEMVQEAAVVGVQTPDGTIVEQEVSPNILSAKLRKVHKVGRPKVDILAPDYIRVNSDHYELSLENARYVSYNFKMYRYELTEMGFSASDLSRMDRWSETAGDSGLSEEDSHREQRIGHTDEASTSDLDAFAVREAYYLVDFDGDGRTERRMIRYSGSVVIENQECETVPIAAGAVFPVPHQWLGCSMFDKAKQIQDVKTALLRQALDNIYLSNNNRLMVMEGQANINDLNVSRPGGWVRIRHPNAITPLPFNPTAQYSLSMLQYMDKMRTERGGTALDMQNESNPVSHTTAYATERLISSREQLAAFAIQNFAETFIRDIFIHLHRIMRKHSPAMLIKRRDEFTPVAPQAWRPRYRVGMAVGLSLGERARKLQALMAVQQQQMVAMQSGFDGVLVDASKIYNVQSDIVINSGLQSVERYWIDPASQQAQQAVQAKQQAAQEQAAQQAKMAEIQLQLTQAQNEILRMREETRQLEVALKDDQAARKQVFDYDKLRTDNDTKRMDIELKYDTDVPGGAGVQ
jgi:hypothetical protein